MDTTDVSGNCSLNFFISFLCTDIFISSSLFLVVNNSHALGLFLSESDAKVWGISWVVKKKAWSFVVDHKRPQMTTKGIVKRYNKKGIK